MQEILSRTTLLLGEAAMQKLAASRVAVFGVGGVGGHAVEALVRSGIGAIDLIDNDCVALSNLNRQLFATLDTVGMYKVDAAAARIRQLSETCKVTTHKTFYLPETAGEFDFTNYDYVIDAIDTISGKLMLVERAQAAGTPIISSMGAGNKLDPTAFRVADLYETSVCPLAKVMRRELKKRGIQKLKVVYSEEQPAALPPDTLAKLQAESGSPKRIPASIAFVPSVVGMILAGEVIKDLAGCNQ